MELAHSIALVTSLRSTSPGSRKPTWRRTSKLVATSSGRVVLGDLESQSIEIVIERMDDEQQIGIATAEAGALYSLPRVSLASLGEDSVEVKDCRRQSRLGLLSLPRTSLDDQSAGHRDERPLVYSNLLSGTSLLSGPPRHGYGYLSFVCLKGTKPSYLTLRLTGITIAQGAYCHRARIKRSAHLCRLLPRCG